MDVDPDSAIAQREFFGPDMPFGGYRQSGIGREMGLAGFGEYLETKVIAVGA
ncbi:aldehyde dehydrogenase family protein [Parafrankia discariae]|uniref:aldehyde dehydrogenase family protein n=1 Tax=Parafrankia discariae TaxID=365528 RepID=UPI00036ACCB5|nr:aldehyde dehydrogenase family protein [Parafrankia discariae]